MRCTNQPNRKASLSISTNAIVVLIIAVIMLGLIIGLVTQAFGAVEQKFLDQLRQEQDPPSTSTNRPITLNKQSVSGSPDDLLGFKVNIRNPNDEEKTLKPQLNCTNDDVFTGNQTNERSVPGNSQETFTFIFYIDGAANSGANLCQVQAVNDSNEVQDDIRSADITIMVQ